MPMISISQFTTSDDDEFLHWVFKAEDPAVETIKKDPGIDTVENNSEDEVGAAFPQPSPTARLPPNKVKRALEYATTKASPDLVFISQPQTVKNLDDLENYVYEKKGGKGIRIYHVELGVTRKSATQKAELTTDSWATMQTKLSKDEKQPLDEENPATQGHGTATFSKIVGNTYGSNRGSKAIVVKMASGAISEQIDVWNQIWSDISSKPERKKKSIVTYSMYSQNKPQDPNNLSKGRQQQKAQMKKLMDHDVPIIGIAGNDAQQSGRANVDTAPGVYVGPNFPLILVGATDNAGKKAPFSQSGNLVTLLAPGVKVPCLDYKEDSTKPVLEDGTSFAAPLVAGVLATFMAYDTVPFDLADGKVAANAKAFLQNKANWERQTGVKAIWNLVEEKDNKPKGGAAVQPATPVVAPVDPPSDPKCVEKTKIRDAHDYHETPAVDFFCGKYAKGTIEPKPDIHQAVTWEVIASGGYTSEITGKDYDGDGKTEVDDVYDVSLTAVDNCTPDGGKYNLAQPLKGHFCGDILWDAWKKCNNEGRGGAITAGCLVYSVETRW